MKAEKENKHSRKSIAVHSEQKEQSRGVEYALQRTSPKSCLQLIAVRCTLH